jgi:hypothetical protein
MDNKHFQSIPQEVLDQAIAKMNEANAILKPYILSLTPDERKNILKLGDKSVPFVEKAFGYTQTDPEFIPSFLNVKDFEIDLTDFKKLVGPVSLARQLLYALDDTMMIAGSESYYAGLYYYKNVQQAAAMNIPGAKAIYEDLKKRFPSFTRKADEDTADASK